MPKKKTNFEKIVSMNEPDLAKFLVKEVSLSLCGVLQKWYITNDSKKFTSMDKALEHQIEWLNKRE